MNIAALVLALIIGWFALGWCVAILWGDSAKQRDSLYVDVEKEKAA